MVMTKTFAAVLLTFMLASTALAAPPVTVKTYAQHLGEYIVYHYQVTNHTTDRRSARVTIGLNYGYDDPNTPSNDEAELTVHPVGSYWVDGPTIGDQAGISLLKGGIYTAPQGWTGYPQVHEETGLISFEFKTTDSSSVITPGQTMNFSITVPKMDQAYLAGHFTAGLRDGPGQMQPLDTTPPSLSGSASPRVLWPPNQKLVPIAATITVTDDYDPQPEIRLESITANEALGAADVADAAFGTDDRQFKLAAKRDGGNKAGRTYTITYSATDASGNKATASTTVIVPHDQRK